MIRFRLLPLLIVTAGASLSLKLSDLWLSYPNSTSLQKIIGGTAQAADPNQATKRMTLAAMVGLGSNEPPPAPAAAAGSKLAPPQASATPGPATQGPGDVPANTILGAKADLPKDPSQFTQSEVELLQSLAQRRDALDAREQQLQQRQLTVEAAEKRLAEKATALEGMKSELMGLINRRNQADDDRLRRLVKIYEDMKPVLAAQILQGMDTKDAVGVLERMKENKVAPVLGAMTPGRAQLLSSLMADRAPSSSSQPTTTSGDQGKNTFSNTVNKPRTIN
ncbi:MAG: hypothetical protein ORO03_05415 [Alphaproteobacteria bacterium]|nr:hypothetical protein [Alphaproteobacteria bacterium]